jgi:lysine decarboxylase
MEAPLYETLKHYRQLKNHSFHMPGHKGGTHIPLEEIIGFDVTELDGLDNLHAPVGIIDEAQKRASRLYGTEKSYFLINGSTVGILASILGLTNKGDKILVARNCHKSVYHGLILNELKPVYVYPEMIEAYGISGSVSYEKIEQAIKEHPDIKIAIITSPTYEGITSDIEKIASILHNKNIPLIVDEAHGAHFRFHQQFPQSAIQLGADIVIHSLHKTLPALTQTALLHINNKNIPFERIKEYLGMLQTSSPSYVLMASMDYCLGLLEDTGKTLYEDFYHELISFRKKIYQKLRYIKLIDENIAHTKKCYELDISKLIFYVGDTDHTGHQLEALLRNQYKVQMELSNQNIVLGMTTVSNTKDSLDQLFQAITTIDGQFKEKSQKTDILNIEEWVMPILTPYEAKNRKHITVQLNESIGKIAAEFVIPYPPGIPLIAPGEKITQNIIKIIKQYQLAGHAITGLKDLSLNYMDIVEGV